MKHHAMHFVWHCIIHWPIATLQYWDSWLMSKDLKQTQRLSQTREKQTKEQRPRPRRFVFCLSLPTRVFLFFSFAAHFSMRQLPLSCFEYLNFARRCAFAIRVFQSLFISLTSYKHTVQISISWMHFLRYERKHKSIDRRKVQSAMSLILEK